MCRNLVLEVILGFIEGKQHDRKLSSVVTAYLNGQDGAVLPARDYTLSRKKNFPEADKLKPYNKFFIDQVCSVKMTGYWPRSYF